MDSLWGEEFNIPTKTEKTKKVLKKIAKPKVLKEVKASNARQVKKLSLDERLALITDKVKKVLYKQKDNILVIKDRETFDKYIDSCIEHNIIAVDTETNNSLDPITCKLMGLCLYTPDQKQAYIPINHADKTTKERFDWQMTENDVREELERINNNKIFTITHNGKFDYQVLKCTCGVEIRLDWDTMMGCRLIDENEKSAGLKQQYIAKIDPEQEKYDIEDLFQDIPYEFVDPDIFAYYSATDSFMTWKLYQYQMDILDEPQYKRVLELARTVEMPCVQVTAEMELRGVSLDKEYAKRLQDKYHNKSDKINKTLENKLQELLPKIESWKLSAEANEKQWKSQTLKQYTNAVKGSGFDAEQWKNNNGVWYKLIKPKVEQLDNPLTVDSLASPLQLGILLYDILGCPHVNKEKPYKTGEAELKKLSETEPLCELMLKKRALDKLLNAFIDTLPNKINIDGRIHGHFNQYGTGTGRYSSTSPNLQQIPSHNKEIRLLFCGDTKEEDIEIKDNIISLPYINEILTDKGWRFGKDLIIGDKIELENNLVGSIINLSSDTKYTYIKVDNINNLKIKTRIRYVLIGSDFSQQEPRLLSQFSQDDNMINAYKQGKDLYATIAMGVFHNKYEDNLEHNLDGSPNPEGKKRRGSCKNLLLGIMYGRGVASIAEQIKSTPEEAQKIIDNFYKGFPKVKEWMDKTEAFAKENGYAEDLWGRRRRLPDIQLPKFTVRYKDKNMNNGDFNPFLECSNRTNVNYFEKYNLALEKVRSRQQIDQIKADAAKEGIEIINNGGFISAAQRQCVNSSIQGSAATMTKKAMIKIFNDPRLRELDYHMEIGVHDELIGECPFANVDKVADYVTEDMRTCAQDTVTVPFKCDPDYSFNWYFPDLCATIKQSYLELIKGDEEKNIKPLSEQEAFDRICKEHCELTVDNLQEVIYRDFDKDDEKNWNEKLEKLKDKEYLEEDSEYDEE